jgi:hypothetical protein
MHYVQPAHHLWGTNTCPSAGTVQLLGQQHPYPGAGHLHIVAHLYAKYEMHGVHLTAEDH